MGSHALKHEPLDAYNLALTENLHPTGWVNPTPADRYNMVVIGAGTGSLAGWFAGGIDRMVIRSASIEKPSGDIVPLAVTRIPGLSVSGITAS